MVRGVVGLGITLIALSDLLLGRPGARWAVLALRTVAQLSFVGVVLGWAWAAANGSGLAVVALVSGLAAVVFAYWLRWAREADRRDAARDAAGNGSS